MLNALSFDVEDWFHIIDIPGLDDASRWDSLPSIVERRTDEFLEVTAAHNVRATFFVLGWIEERYPSLVDRIASGGHEIGSHTYWHPRVSELTPNEFREDLALSLDAIEAACGIRPRTFRAPSFSILPGSEWAFSVMVDLGIEYDASLFPGTRGHGGFDCQLQPHVRPEVRAPDGSAFWELPMTILPTPLKRLAFTGGGYLRLLPPLFIKRALRWTNAQGRPGVAYLHPRDLAPDCPRVPMPMHRRFKCYVGLGTTRAKLEALLDDFHWGTCREVLEEWSNCHNPQDGV